MAARATIAVEFRGQEFRGRADESCPGTAMSAVIREVMTGMKNAFGAANLTGESVGRMRVSFQGKTFIGKGIANRPGMAASGAMADVMTVVRQAHPKKRRLRRVSPY